MTLSHPRTKERASVEGVLSGLRATTSKATERLVQDSCIKAVEQREQVLLELHGKEMSDLKAELHKEHKEHEQVKREHADLHREHTVLQEEMKDMINTNEENERKHHHLETNATNAVKAKTMGKAIETPKHRPQLLSNSCNRPNSAPPFPLFSCHDHGGVTCRAQISHATKSSGMDRRNTTQWVIIVYSYRI